MAPVALLLNWLAYMFYYVAEWEGQYANALASILGLIAFGTLLDSWRQEEKRHAHLWGCHGAVKFFFLKNVKI
jgi:hypothetical protein